LKDWLMPIINTEINTVLNVDTILKYLWWERLIVSVIAMT